MPKDWKPKPDKGPSIDDEVPRHRRKRGKKTFVIQRRYVGPEFDPNHAWLYKRNWHTHRAYHSETALSNAWAALQKSARWKNLREVFELRIKRTSD